jgi:hypothetical protein
MSTELHLLITRTANAYFWVFLVSRLFILVYEFLPSAKKITRIQIEKGTYNIYNGVSLSIITWVLFVLSMYYK